MDAFEEVVDKYIWSRLADAAFHVQHVNNNCECACRNYPEAVAKTINSWSEFAYFGKVDTEFRVIENNLGELIIGLFRKGGAQVFDTNKK